MLILLIFNLARMINRKRSTKLSKAAESKQKLRIISGKWRGRKFSFPAIPGLRPTPDRVRETLFNWLAPYLPGARCLDLFAGSGALGLEALSRGAAYVDFYDASLLVIKHLQTLLKDLQETKARLHLADVPRQLPAEKPQPFDIVFLDPPFNQGLVEVCSQWLAQQGWIADNGFIYIETEYSSLPPNLPEGWKIIKTSRAGQVSCYLAQRF